MIIFAPRTFRTLKILSGMSGRLALDSLAINPASKTAAADSDAIVRTLVQPHNGAWLKASTSRIRLLVASKAPGVSSLTFSFFPLLHWHQT